MAAFTPVADSRVTVPGFGRAAPAGRGSYSVTSCFVDEPAAVALAAIWRWLPWMGEREMAIDGLISKRSSFGPEETMQRLEAEVQAKGLTVFAHIDHAAGAAAVGLSLRPTDLLIFGNAKGGTPLMEIVQAIGIDLPLKALVWQDVTGNTWVSYNDPAWLSRRHGIDPATDATTAALSAMLDAIAKAATAPA
jgi:uncharacterized protein (DUF302 family)